MSIQETIESGSLELYVMGALPPEEMKEIDSLRKTHPELNTEIARIEEAMIAYADHHAIKPKDELKEKIAQKLTFSVNLDMQAEMVDSISIQMPGIFRYAAAAAVLLIVVLGTGTVYYAHQYKDASAQVAALQHDKIQMASEVKQLTNEQDQVKAELAVAMRPENKKIALAGTPLSPASKAVVYWDKETGNTYINSAYLPAVPTNKQYQLWAMVNGKPVDLGVISKDTPFNTMKQINNASAFCITLEPLGGSPVPTLAQLYASGNV